MTILYEILSTIFTIIAAVVVVSFSFLWYEAANRDPALLNGRTSPSRLWLAAKLIVTEFISFSLILISSPFGWSSRPDSPASDQTGTPVILLHGLFNNRAAWLWFKYRLRRKRLTDLYTINLPVWKDIETLTERVARLIDELRQQRGIEKVHLIGHSMGGIIARNYLQIRGGAEKVDRCILIGTPNSGSKMVPFVITNLGKNLIPGSPFLTNLNTKPFPKNVRLTNIYSRHDNLVVPFELARLNKQTNVELSGVGHNTLLFHPEAFNATYTALTEDHANNQP
jgi:triacylglycerol esterase/lipase EstA (alpha/beta hydrolase family)